MRSRSCAILRDSPACARARASAVRGAIKSSPENEGVVIFANSRAQDNKGLLSDHAVEMDRRFQQKHARLLPPAGTPTQKAARQRRSQSAVSPATLMNA